MGRRGIVAFLDEGDHTGERAPVVELGARAVTAVVVGRLVQREILADVPVLPPLRESSKLVICLQRAFRPERTMGTWSYAYNEQVGGYHTRYAQHAKLDLLRVLT